MADVHPPADKVGAMLLAHRTGDPPGAGAHRSRHRARAWFAAPCWRSSRRPGRDRSRGAALDHVDQSVRGDGGFGDDLHAAVPSTDPLGSIRCIVVDVPSNFDVLSVTAGSGWSSAGSAGNQVRVTQLRRNWRPAAAPEHVVHGPGRALRPARSRGRQPRIPSRGAPAPVRDPRLISVGSSPARTDARPDADAGSDPAADARTNGRRPQRRRCLCRRHRPRCRCRRFPGSRRRRARRHADRRIRRPARVPRMTRRHRAVRHATSGIGLRSGRRRRYIRAGALG